MAALESEAEFLNRLEELGLAAEQDVFVAKGWATFGKFAFSTSYVPGTPDDQRYVEDVLIPVLGDRAHPKAASLRRLYFESYTMTVAELRRKLELKFTS